MLLLSPDEAARTLDALGQFYSALAAQRWYGDHVCMAAQPSTPNGSVEDVLANGVPEAASITSDWGDEIANAVDGADTEAAIRYAIDTAEIDTGPLADTLADGMLWSSVIGGLDSLWEREHEDQVDLLQFSAGQSRAFDTAISRWNEREVMPREAFEALDDWAKSRAFTFAGAASQDVLATAHAELGRMIEEGKNERGGPNFRDFKKFWKERVESAGWTPSNPSHVETIYRTNVLSAYSSGRYIEATQPKVAAALPYWQVRTVKDSRRRKSHGRLHGLLLPKSDPFWQSAFPPFGYNCRCRCVSRSKVWVDRNKVTIGPHPSDVPDPGFASGTRTLVQVPASVVRKQNQELREQEAKWREEEQREAQEKSESEAAAAEAARREANKRADAERKEAERKTREEAELKEEARKKRELEQRRKREAEAKALRDKAEDERKAAQAVQEQAPASIPQPKQRSFADDLKRGGVDIDDQDEGLVAAVEKNLGEVSVAQIRKLSGARRLTNPEIEVMQRGRSVLVEAVGEEASVERAFYRNRKGELEVYHSTFIVEQPHQGKGIAKRVLLDQFEEYEKLGVKKVKLSAVDVGRYTWPKMGFRMSTPQEFPRIRDKFVSDLVAKGHQVTDAEKLGKSLKSLNELARAELNGAKVGKDFLLGANNDGLYELQIDVDPKSEAYQKLKAYLKGQKATRERMTGIKHTQRFVSDATDLRPISDEEFERSRAARKRDTAAEDLMDLVEHDDAIRFDEHGNRLDK